MFKLKVFSGSASQLLTTKICANLGIPSGEVFLRPFPSGERHVQFKENIRGDDIYIVQSASFPANDNLMELLVMIDAARRASAGRINVVCPWMAYSRAERKDKSRMAISAKLVLKMIESAGADRIISMDLHSPSVQGFVEIPFDNLYALPTLIEALPNEVRANTVMVAPDIGATKKIDALSRAYGLGYAFIVKRRLNDSEVEVSGFVGDIKGKTALVCDDLSESCSTLISAANKCREEGATQVFAAITHAMFNEIGLGRLSATDTIDRLYTSNTVPLIRSHEKIEVVGVEGILSEAIQRTHNNESISELFNIGGF